MTEPEPDTLTVSQATLVHLRKELSEACNDRDRLTADAVRLATWIMDHCPDVPIATGVVDAAIELLERAYEKPKPAEQTTLDLARLVGLTLAEHLVIAGLSVTWHDGEVAIPAEWEPSPALVEDMGGLRRLYRAVEYDRHDREADRAAVVIAAVRAGLTPVPSAAIDPRTYRGCATQAPETPIERLIERSSLGTPDAVAMRARTPHAVARAAVAAAGQPDYRDAVGLLLAGVRGLYPLVDRITALGGAA